LAVGGKVALVGSGRVAEKEVILLLGRNRGTGVLEDFGNRKQGGG